MSFQLKFDEPVDAGWRRIVHEQIDNAVKLLHSGKDVDAAIHETRKSMKRVRALLKLLRPGLSTADYKRENERYATIARMLSELRDEAILVQTASELAKRATGRTRAVALEIIGHVQRQARKPSGLNKPSNASPSARKRRVAEVIAALGRASKAVDRLELHSNSFAIVRRGLQRSYRAGRLGMKDAYESNRDESFHEWRKAVQAHWRHMLLLERAWPDLFAARIALAREMSDLLGADHDLFMLISRARSQRPSAAEADGVGGLIQLAQARQQEIREELRAKAAALFAEKPKGFVARIDSYWNAAKAARKLAKKRRRTLDAAKAASSATHTRNTPNAASLSKSPKKAAASPVRPKRKPMPPAKRAGVRPAKPSSGNGAAPVKTATRKRARASKHATPKPHVANVLLRRSRRKSAAKT